MNPNFKIDGEFYGKSFLSFWVDNESILNVVFNYNKNRFEIYDDKKIRHIKVT